MRVPKSAGARSAVRISWCVGGEVFASAPHAVHLPDYEPETYLHLITSDIYTHLISDAARRTAESASALVPRANA